MLLTPDARGLIILLEQSREEQWGEDIKGYVSFSNLSMKTRFFLVSIKVQPADRWNGAVCHKTDTTIEKRLHKKRKKLLKWTCSDHCENYLSEVNCAINTNQLWKHRHPRKVCISETCDIVIKRFFFFFFSWTFLCFLSSFSFGLSISFPSSGSFAWVIHEEQRIYILESNFASTLFVGRT